MKIAFLFSGQGSQYTHMYSDFYQNDSVFKTTIDSLNKQSKLPLLEYGINTNSSNIFNTEIAQPLITAYQIAIVHSLKAHGIFPSVVGGMSLGQYAASEAAGVLNAQDTLRLVSRRGMLMKEDCILNQTSMLVLLGNTKFTQHVIESSPFNSRIRVSNFNSSDQLVVGGDLSSIKEFREWLKNKDFKITAIPLKNEGAFHTDYFLQSSSKLRKYAQTFDFLKAKIPIVDNESGRINFNYSPEKLASHMISPVQWVSDMDEVLKLDIDTIIEIGPGSQLLQLLSQTSYTGNKLSIKSSADLVMVKEVI